MFIFTISVNSMKQIIVFELKKMFRNKLLLFMLLLFGILNLYRIYSGYRKQTGSEPQFYSAYFRIYENVSGEWNNDIIRYVVAEYEKAKAVVDAGGFSTEPNQPGTHTGYIFGDMNVFEQIKNEMDERYHYEQTMRKLTANAAENAAFYEQKGNTELAAKNRKIAETYQDRKVTAFYDTWGLNEYFKYDFSTLLILILMILMLSPLFAKEHELEMHGLLHLAQNAGKLPVCKLAAGGIAVCAVSLLFFTEDFLAFRSLYHISGLFQPVNTLDGYFYSPLHLRIGTYILLNAALKILSFLVLGSICSAVSAAAKHELVPFCVSFSVMLMLVAGDAFAGSSVLSVLNPVTLLSGKKLFREFQTVSFFGTPFFSYVLPISAAALELFWLIAGIIIISRASARKRRHRVET